MITVENISVSFGEKQVLKNCSLRVPRGAHAALTGPSGCGKTTLARCVLGLEKPLSGIVETEGSISCVFQEPRLFPWLTAEENVNSVLGGKKETLPEARKWLERVGLGDSGGIYPPELSGGMAQRVSIARALAFGGDILILDEPLKGLDTGTRTTITKLLSDFTAERTLLLITHDDAEAAVLCDTIYKFCDGSFSPVPGNESKYF